MADDLKAQLLAAALPHVPFDGWSEVTLRAAARDLGLDAGVVHALYPRGGVDLALAYHEAGDQAMLQRLALTDLSHLRFRDRIAAAVLARLPGSDRELVRRSSALFALPQHSGDGVAAIWRTADRIWSALGDPSTDVNWYSKRATLSAVYAATVLFWLGDNSVEVRETRDFLNRRIDNVMGIEGVKARFRDSLLGKAFMAGPGRALSMIRAPGKGGHP